MAGLPDRAVTPFRLLCLPLELQHNVSRQAYPPTTLRGECNAAARTSWRGAHSLNLLLACKHVHKEATPFYRASFVHLDTSELRWHHIEKSLGTSDRDWIVAVVRKVTDCCHTTLDGGPSTLEMPFESLQSFTFRCAYGGYAGFDPDEEGLHHSIEYYLQDQSTIGLLKLFVEQYFTKHRRLDILRHLGINAEFWLGLKEEYRSLHHWRVVSTKSIESRSRTDC